MGIVVVAAFAANTAGKPPAAITVAGRRTRSSINAGNRSFRPSAKRYFIAVLRKLHYGRQRSAFRDWWCGSEPPACRTHPTAERIDEAPKRRQVCPEILVIRCTSSEELLEAGSRSSPRGHRG